MRLRDPVKALAKARNLQRRALANYAKVMRAGSFGRSAATALERYERQTEEADRLFDALAEHLEREAQI